jgi:hypothetical protein
MTDNMKLWEAVERTDPKFVKPITGKSYSGNSPSPYYLVKKATETFGPCGIGWGFRIEEEKLLDGAVLEGGTIEKISHARVVVWYNWGGSTGSVEHVGQTVFCGRRRNGVLFTDEDAPKKSVTDALTKALSMIGFAGDIFSGRWDDNRYVEELRNEATQRPVSQNAPQYIPPTPPPYETTAVPQQAPMVTGGKVAFDPDQWAADVKFATEYTDKHEWSECLAWWAENKPMLERIQERDPLVYSTIYHKFTAKKKAHHASTQL